MTQEEKDILLKDLCARLPYGVICRYEAAVPLVGEVLNYGPLQEIRRKGEYFTVNGANCLYEDIKPYLRPMSSMTEEEEKEYTFLCNDGGWGFDGINCSIIVDWLNEHMFDYRGLIEKGLALVAPEGMYDNKKQD